MVELRLLGFEDKLIAKGYPERPADLFQRDVTETIQPRFDPTLIDFARELDELRQSLGYGAFTTVDQLSRLTGQYNAALPILAKYIDAPWQEDLNAMHIRLFATKAALPYWDRLKEMYIATDSSERPKTKEALALALTEIVERNKDAHLLELIELAKLKPQGEWRKQFTHALEKSKNPAAANALADMAGDSDIKDFHFASLGRSAALRYVVPNERYRDVVRREKNAKKIASK